MAAEVGTGLSGGYVGTRVPEPVSEMLCQLEPEADRKREDVASARRSVMRR